jgi:glycosyltransferase involved in cell wall biosynthesis
MYTQVAYNNMKNMITRADLLVGCAECVCEKLRIMGGQRVALQYECVDLKFRDRLSHGSRQELREKHGLPADKYIWIMSGTVEYRKGIDLLPKLAQLLGDQVHIICLGKVYSGYGFYIEQELKYHHIDNVTISGFKKEDYYDYLLLSDGFVLTSREDPFPLVMIEAASLGLPIASFNSGGVKEFVGEGMGTVVDTNEVEDLAEAMRKIMIGEAGIVKEKIVARAEAFDAVRQTAHWEKIMVEKYMSAQVQSIQLN